LAVRRCTIQVNIGTISVRKRTEPLDWDGLRYFRALAAARTLTGAAQRLRVQHTTVARRIDQLEHTLGARLFLRNPRGYVLTSVGETLLESVEAINARIDDVARLAGGEDLELAGPVRVATADLLATHVVVPALRSLIESMPQLDLAVVSDTRLHELSRREADLAVRLGQSSEAHLVIKHLGRVGFGIYAKRGTTKRGKLAKASFVGFDDSVGPQPHDNWLATNAPEARVVFRANRQHTLVEAVRQGVGVGILPCVAADGDAALVRVLGPSEVFSRELYLVMHPDIRHTRRVRAVIDSIERFVSAEGGRLRGA
jgi:DNA-binding transcriptional LysR family regulator